MRLLNSASQQRIDDYYDASGSITTGGTVQLLLPQRKSCSLLINHNLSAEALMLQFGILPATAALTNGAVTSVTVNDAGFGFKVPPEVFFYGGGNNGDLASYGATMPDWPTPTNVASGRAVMGTSAISGLQINSIEIDNPGSGYLAPPFVYILPSRRDPTGVGLASSTVGTLLTSGGGSYYVNGTFAPTTAISVYGGTTGQAYTCKWAS